MRREVVSTWLDAGIPEALLEANRHLLAKGPLPEDQAEVPAGVAIIPPVTIAPGAQVANSVIGPYVSIGKSAKLKNVVISNSIIDARAVIENKVIEGSLVGCDTVITGKVDKLNWEIIHRCNDERPGSLPRRACLPRPPAGSLV